MIPRLLVALALAGCSEAHQGPSCPAGTHIDEARSDAVRARLASVPSGASLLREAGARLTIVCFAPPTSPSVVDDAHDVILASDLDEGEAAARLGHLLVHLRDGLPDEGLRSSDCDAAVDHALALEATAYVREVELQHALGVTPRALAFEFAADVLAAPPGAREAIVQAYLAAHPEGAPGIDGLASAYRERCVSARR
jgi:hypothetical protein